MVLSQIIGFAGTAQAEGNESSFYESLWSKLRVVLSNQAARSESRVSAVAGIRGARQKGDAELQPVWLDVNGKVRKDDKSNESTQVEKLHKAEALAANRQFTKALKAYEEFLAQYPGSEFAPVVEFSIALVYTELSDKQTSRQRLDSFLQKYPRHSLADEARKIKDRL
jgi:tetratricopeptide (TPR) repeat protein